MVDEEFGKRVTEISHLLEDMTVEQLRLFTHCSAAMLLNAAGVPDMLSTCTFDGEPSAMVILTGRKRCDRAIIFAKSQGMRRHK